MSHPLTFGITGARGFVGSELTRLLRLRGHHVIPFSRDAPTGEERFVPYTLDEPPSIDDLRAIDVLIHAAYDFRCRDASVHRTRNIDGSITLLQRAAQAGVARSIFISSLSAFPGCRSAYGQGKLEVEAEATRLGALVLRLGLVTSDTEGGLAGSLRGLVRSLPVIPLPGMGGQRLYLLTSADLAASVEGLLSTPWPGGQVISLAAPRPLAFREILRDLAQQQGRRVWLVPFPWQAMWLGLKALEQLGAGLNFRSDSLLSLVNQDPSPDLRECQTLGFLETNLLKTPATFSGEAPLPIRLDFPQ